MNGSPLGVPDLGATRHIPIREQRIVYPADVTVWEGGMTQDGCDVHIRVVHISTGDVYYVPLPTRVAAFVFGQLRQLVGENPDQSQHEGSSHD